MSTYTYYHCYKCGYHGTNANGGKCPNGGSEDYHAEQEQEQD